MTKQEILNYITQTPENSNPNVLGTMLNEFADGQKNSWTEAGAAAILEAISATVSKVTFDDDDNSAYNETTGLYIIDTTFTTEASWSITLGESCTILYCSETESSNVISGSAEEDEPFMLIFKVAADA